MGVLLDFRLSLLGRLWPIRQRDIQDTRHYHATLQLYIPQPRHIFLYRWTGYCILVRTSPYPTSPALTPAWHDSYFSSVFAASKNFPKYIGAAAGTSMALFGLSPTFLSLLASRYFSSPDGEIDITRFLQFLAILCGCVHLVGGFTMHIIPSAPKEESNSAIIASDPEVPNERTVLLPNKTNGNDDERDQVQVDVVSVSDDSPESKESVLDLLSDRNFWALVFIVFVVLGSVSCSSHRRAGTFGFTRLH
jgi:hypothetical protein